MKWEGKDMREATKCVKHMAAHKSSAFKERVNMMAATLWRDGLFKSRCCADKCVGATCT